MSLKDTSAAKLRKIKAKWHADTPEELEEREREYLKERMYSKEPTIKGQVRITAGKVKNFLIDIPRNTRPLTDRMKVRIFDVLKYEIANKTILDLYAGSGSFGLDALSRGAGFATFVDASKHAFKALNSSVAKTGFVAQTEVVREKVEDFLYKIQKEEKSFEIIFIDPPYKLFNSKRMGNMEAIINMAGNILPGVRDANTKKFKGAMIIKHPRRYPIGKLNLDHLKIVETLEFGLNAISILIVENK